MNGAGTGIPLAQNMQEAPGMLGALAAKQGPTPEQMQMAQGNQQNPMARFMMQLQDPAQRDALAGQLAGVMPPPPEDFLKQFVQPPRIMPAEGQTVAQSKGPENAPDWMQGMLGGLMRPRGGTM